MDIFYQKFCDRFSHTVRQEVATNPKELLQFLKLNRNVFFIRSNKVSPLMAMPVHESETSFCKSFCHLKLYRRRLLAFAYGPISYLLWASNFVIWKKSQFTRGLFQGINKLLIYHFELSQRACTFRFLWWKIAHRRMVRKQDRQKGRKWRTLTTTESLLKALSIASILLKLLNLPRFAFPSGLFLSPF